MSCHTCSALTWVLGPWTQVSTFTQQILSALGHCPSPLLTSIFSYKHTHVYDKGNLEDCFPAKMMSVLRIRTKKDFFSFLPVAMVCLLGDRGDGMYRSFKSVTSLLCQSNITFKFHLLFLFPTLMFALKRHLWRGKEGSSCTHTQEPIKRNSQSFDIKKSSEMQQVSLVFAEDSNLSGWNRVQMIIDIGSFIQIHSQLSGEH